MPTQFESILWLDAELAKRSRNAEQPAFFRDLNLDQFVHAVTENYKDCDIAGVFNFPLNNLDAIAYRQEVIRDLENESLLQAIESFSSTMQVMRERLETAKKLSYQWARHRCFLSAAEAYSRAVHRLANDLAHLTVASRGMKAFHAYLLQYRDSSGFETLARETDDVLSQFLSIRFSLLIKDGGITVRRYDGEGDYSIAVEETFTKFRRDSVKDFRFSIPKWDDMNHIEAQVLDNLALLFPESFKTLEVFCAERANHFDERILRFHQEIHFYLAYRAYMERLRSSGLSFCRPVLSQTSKEIGCRNAFDLVLASKLLKEKKSVVCNDFFLEGRERILVVSGPNQGGKTTFARMFGQLHYLASLGLPVPGTECRLTAFDHLLTHFEKDEDVTNLRGKLHDELVRMREVLDQATSQSIVIINEIFSSTMVKDALYLGNKILARLEELDLIALIVTFLDELSTFSERTVSVVSLVDATNPAVRTFKLERKAADGLAHAVAIAQKYRVTYNDLKERLKR